MSYESQLGNRSPSYTDSQLIMRVQTHLLIDKKYQKEATVFLNSAFLNDFFLFIQKMTYLQPPCPTEVSLRITTDESIHFYNKTYRQRDKSTNILSFPSTQKGEPWILPPDGLLHLGDLILSWPFVLKEAKTLSIPLRDHLMHLLAHGFLHLLHYDHHLDREAKEMELLERKALAYLGITLSDHGQPQHI